jgi:hypothetical protein
MAGHFGPMFVASVCLSDLKEAGRNRFSRLCQRSRAIVAGFGTWQGQQRAEDIWSLDESVAKGDHTALMVTG